MLNAAIADVLSRYADRLEGVSDFNTELHNLIRETIKAHKRIIFNGNGYDEKWVEEATKVRGLLNLKTTPDCLPYLISEKNVSMLTRQKVYTKEELHSRYEILLENYCKTINIEALTMIDMARKEILPAVTAYINELASTAAAKKALCDSISCSYEEKLVKHLSALVDIIDMRTNELENILIKVKESSNISELSCAFRDEVLPAMQALRIAADEAESVTAEKFWPYPTYGDLLFSVR